MTLFLTSSPTGDLDGSFRVDGYDYRNGFRDLLAAVWPMKARCLMITAFPENIPASEEMSAFFHEAVSLSGLTCSAFDLCDDRNSQMTKDELQSYDIIFLGGGHVPTQNAFFLRLSLKEKLEGYSGVVIGISAGSMNCAKTVYAMPEEPGEATDICYQRFIPGLGLTDLNILPHYQLAINSVKDGLPLYESIILPDSVGHRFLCLPDGSFVLEKEGVRQIFGEHHWVHNGLLD